MPSEDDAPDSGVEPFSPARLPPSLSFEGRRAVVLFEMLRLMDRGQHSDAFIRALADTTGALLDA